MGVTGGGVGTNQFAVKGSSVSRELPRAGRGFETVRLVPVRSEVDVSAVPVSAEELERARPFVDLGFSVADGLRLADAGIDPADAEGSWIEDWELDAPFVPGEVIDIPAGVAW